MALFDKLSGIAKNIGDKATDAIEMTKLNSKIGAEKTAINECLRQIGDYYFKKHQAGEPDDPGVADMLAAIDDHNRVIADTQDEIARMQAANASQSQGAQNIRAAGEITCTSCGTSNPQGTKFCSQCGAVLEAPEELPGFICPECGAQVAAGSKFCVECGHKF